MEPENHSYFENPVQQEGLLHHYPDGSGFHGFVHVHKIADKYGTGHRTVCFPRTGRRTPTGCAFSQDHGHRHQQAVFISRPIRIQRNPGLSAYRLAWQCKLESLCPYRQSDGQYLRFHFFSGSDAVSGSGR